MKPSNASQKVAEDTKYEQISNPYLDASVLASLDKNKVEKKSTQDNFNIATVPDDGMNITPLSAKKLLDQLPWKNMNDYGLTMECNVVIKRDKDILREKLQKENERLMQRIKIIEKQLKEQEIS